MPQTINDRIILLQAPIITSAHLGAGHHERKKNPDDGPQHVRDPGDHVLVDQEEGKYSKRGRVLHRHFVQVLPVGHDTSGGQRRERQREQVEGGEEAPDLLRPCELKPLDLCGDLQGREVSSESGSQQRLLLVGIAHCRHTEDRQNKHTHTHTHIRRLRTHTHTHTHTAWICTCMVPTKMFIDMKPCDLDTFMIMGAKNSAARKPSV